MPCHTERLNGVALKAFEGDVLEEIDVESVVDDFASKICRKSTLIK